MKIAVLNFADSGIYDYAKYTIPIMSKWCMLNGYQYILHSDTDSPWDKPWNKIFMLQKYLSYFDVCVVLDADIYIANKNLKIENLLEKYSKPLLACDDTPNGGTINTGSIVVRNCDWSINFLNLVEKMGTELRKENRFYWEQDCIAHLYAEKSDVRENIEVMPINSLNSHWLDCDNLERDFDIYHVMARPLHEKVEKIIQLSRRFPDA